MPHHEVTVECPVPSSFAVDQVRGMFDLPAAETLRESFSVELPADDEPWRIGLIVGASGSGKTTVARSAYGDRFIEDGFRWEKSKAVIDHFPKISIKHVTQTLTSVGFSSPPAWLKPHHVLSGGERFRCDLARALLRPATAGNPANIIAFDEFTSVVDRTVAKIGSAAIAKSIRAGRIAKKFVAVTCHYDVLEWLEPDWVLDMATQQLARGCLYQRPKIELTVAPVHRGAWQLFRRHHYLNHELHRSQKCFVAFWGDEPVAFSSWMHRMTRGRRQHDMREHRTVVLPDFQGVGIGNRMSEICASIFAGVGGRAFSTTSHPGMIHYRHNSPKWRTKRFGMVAPTGGTGMFNRIKTGKATAIEVSRASTKETTGTRALDSAGRVTAGFQYIGPKMPSDEALAMLTAKPRIFGDADAEQVLKVIPTGGSLRTLRSIAARTRMPIANVSRVIARMEKTGDVQAVRVGKRYGYVAT